MLYEILTTQIMLLMPYWRVNDFNVNSILLNSFNNNLSTDLSETAATKASSVARSLKLTSIDLG